MIKTDTEYPTLTESDIFLLFRDNMLYSLSDLWYNNTVMMLWMIEG